MGVLAYNLLHMIRQFYVWGVEVKRSIDWLIKRLIKAGARVSYHARRWYVHVASAFPLAHHYRAVLAWGTQASQPDSIWSPRDWHPEIWRKLTFHPNLCYLTTCGKDWFREYDRLGGFTRSKRVKEPFWDCCN